MAAPMWKTIPCKISEIRLDRTLACGQSFRWKEGRSGEWTGVIGNLVYLLRQSESELFYKVHAGSDGKQSDASSLKGVKQELKDECETNLDNKINYVSLKVLKHIKKEGEDQKTNLNNHANSVEEAILRDYLQLDISLESLYKTWAEADDNFKQISNKYTGIRMLRQEPVECLFSFICSSNNNIARITGMVEKLAVNYGQKLLELDGQEYYSFPEVSALSQEGVEEKLRSLGFGYRAKYIQKSARYIEDNGGVQWLYSLRDMEHKEARAQLIKLCGVGAKVADCVSLFCLDKPGAIPVDTHVWQIAARDYMPKLKQAKSLTDKLYEEIGDMFRSLWGPYAGWAHSVLFTADLRQFKQAANKTGGSKKTKKHKTEPVDGEDKATTKPKKSRRSKKSAT